MFGMPVVASPLATTLESGKPLAHKRWHSRGGCANYAKRIEKKWAKRYGPVKYKPAMYTLTDPFTGRKTLVIHPTLLAELKRKIEREARR